MGLSRYTKLLAGIDPDKKATPTERLREERDAHNWARYALKDHWYDHSKDFDYLDALCEKASIGQYTEEKPRPRDPRTLATVSREDLQEIMHKITVRRGLRWVK